VASRAAMAAAVTGRATRGTTVPFMPGTISSARRSPTR
jgi:hypothetical protein